MNPIAYLQSKGFRITSDPNLYRASYPNGKKHPWGYRNYWERHNGKIIYYDTFSDGYHRAYDLSIHEGAPLPAVVDGTIVAGTKTQAQGGNFGGTVVLADDKGDYQYIYGHCKDLQVQVGDRVKQGQTLAYQSSTNYDNVPMSSHLHFQTQEQQYYATEKAFVVNGIDPLNINVNNYVGTKVPSNTSKKPTETKKTAIHTVKKGDTLWSIAQKYGTSVNQIKSINKLKNDTISIGQKLNLEAINVKTPTPSVPKTEPFKIGKFRKNDLGIEWASCTGTFINGNAEITTRMYSPRLIEKEAKKAKAGERIQVEEVARSSGFIWLKEKGKNRWIPVKTYNHQDGSVGQPWGNF